MPATLALPAIYTAIVALLKADATLTALLAGGAASVYNVAPPGSAFPYVEVGSGTEVEFNTLGPDATGKWGADCTLQISARTQSSGAGSDLPALTIASRIKQLLAGQPLTVSGFPSVNVNLEVVAPIFTEVIDNRAARTQPMIFRVIVHEGAR